MMKMKMAFGESKFIFCHNDSDDNENLGVFVKKKMTDSQIESAHRFSSEVQKRRKFE